MKRYSNFAVVAITFALAACSSASPGADSGEGGAGGDGRCEPAPSGASCTTQADCYFDPCTESTCVDGQCVHALYPNGQICIGVSGGQHFGGMCECGSCVIAVSQNGAQCDAASPCEVAVDQSGACVVETVPGCAVCSAPDGTPGTSRDGGECCGGCWAGSTCRPNPDALACGAGGGLCVPCNGTANCINGACVNQ